jgi:hypothetical protein
MSSRSDFISKRRRRAIYQRDRYRCVWCGCYCSSDTLTLDHVTPRAHGGTHATRNLVTACLSCNSARGCKTMLVFARETAHRYMVHSAESVIVRVLTACEIPILHTPTKRDSRRQSGQLSMVLQEGVLR